MNEGGFVSPFIRMSESGAHFQEIVMDLTENTAVKTTAANTVLNTVLIEDIERTLKLPFLNELCGKTVLITVATGLIVHTLTRVLLHYGTEE